MLLANVLRTGLSSLKTLRPLAEKWARPGYFEERDLAWMEARRLAVVCCHWIGDTFWAAQVIPLLKKRFPSSSITAITKPPCRDLFNGILPDENVTTVTEVTSDRHRENADYRSIIKKAAELEKQNFEVVIDLTGNRYSALFTFLTRPGASIGFDGGGLGWLYTYSVENAHPPGTHLSRRPFRIVSSLFPDKENVIPEVVVPEPPVPVSSPEEIREKAGIGDHPYAVLAPGAGWPAKEWDRENFVKVGNIVRKKGIRIVVTGSRSQADLCESVARKIPTARVMAGQRIGNVAALIMKARAVLSNDSAIGHLAGAFCRRTAVIFTGVTDPAVCGPLGPPELVKTFFKDTDAETVAGHLLPDNN